MYISNFEKELLDSSSDYYYFCGFDSYEIKYINKALCKYMSLDINECIGKKCHNILYGLSSPCGWCLNPELKFDNLKISSVETKCRLLDNQFMCSVFTVTSNEDEEIHVTRFLPNKSLNECFTSNMNSTII